MQKGIVKQLIIILLACVAIVLALALVFYKYIPSNKVIPSKVQAYSMPENIKSEVETKTETISESSQTYEITDGDLEIEKSTKRANPGKSDPFEDYESTNGVSSSGSNQTNGGGTTSNSGTSTSTSNNSGGQNNGNASQVDRNTTDNYYTASNIASSTK